MRVGRCFECGGPFGNSVFGLTAKPVVRYADGEEVRLHRQCADEFDRDERLTQELVDLLREVLGGDE